MPPSGRSRAAQMCRPYGGNGPGALVRQSQARLWNRIRPKFLHTQGPVARIEWQKATQILRAENPTPSQRGNSRNGGPGVSGPMGTKCPSAASPGGVLVTLPPWAKSLAARRRRNSPAKRAIQRPDEGIGPYKKALYYRPLIRPLRGHLSLSPLSLCDISP